MPIMGGGGGGGTAFNGGTITNALTVAANLKVTDGGVNDYLNVTPTAASLTTNPQQGRSALNITDSAITMVDETGAVPLDIEGGFTNLGPGGELSVAAGQVYAVLPAADPGNPGQLYSLAGVVHISP